MIRAKSKETWAKNPINSLTIAVINDDRVSQGVAHHVEFNLGLEGNTEHLYEMDQKVHAKLTEDGLIPVTEENLENRADYLTETFAVDPERNSADTEGWVVLDSEELPMGYPTLIIDLDNRLMMVNEKARGNLIGPGSDITSIAGPLTYVGVKQHEIDRVLSTYLALSE